MIIRRLGFAVFFLFACICCFFLGRSRVGQSILLKSKTLPTESFSLHSDADIVALATVTQYPFLQGAYEDLTVQFAPVKIYKGALPDARFSAVPPNHGLKTNYDSWFSTQPAPTVGAEYVLFIKVINSKYVILNWFSKESFVWPPTDDTLDGVTRSHAGLPTFHYGN